MGGPLLKGGRRRPFPQSQSLFQKQKGKLQFRDAMCFLEEEAHLLTKSGTQAYCFLLLERGWACIKSLLPSSEHPHPAMAPQLEWLYSIHKTGS